MREPWGQASGDIERRVALDQEWHFAKWPRGCVPTTTPGKDARSAPY